MHGRPAHAPDSITRVQATAQLAMLLTGARDDRLAGFTVDFLHRTHGKIPKAEIAAMLAAEMARRARHG